MNEARSKKITKRAQHSVVGNNQNFTHLQMSVGSLLVENIKCHLPMTSPSLNPTFALSSFTGISFERRGRFMSCLKCDKTNFHSAMPSSSKNIHHLPFIDFPFYTLPADKLNYSEFRHQNTKHIFMHVNIRITKKNWMWIWTLVQQPHIKLTFPYGWLNVSCN